MATYTFASSQGQRTHQNSGHLCLCQQPRAAHALRSDQKLRNPSSPLWRIFCCSMPIWARISSTSSIQSLCVCVLSKTIGSQVYKSAHAKNIHWALLFAWGFYSTSSCSGCVHLKAYRPFASPLISHANITAWHYPQVPHLPGQDQVLPQNLICLNMQKFLLQSSLLSNVLPACQPFKHSNSPTVRLLESFQIF